MPHGSGCRGLSKAPGMSAGRSSLSPGPSGASQPFIGPGTAGDLMVGLDGSPWAIGAGSGMGAGGGGQGRYWARAAETPTPHRAASATPNHFFAMFATPPRSRRRRPGRFTREMYGVTPSEKSAAHPETLNLSLQPWQPP